MSSKIGVITRCKQEIYISEFVEYYFNQGINTIYIIDDNSYDKSSIYKSVLKNYSTNLFNGEKNMSVKKSIEGNKTVNLLFDKDIINKKVAGKLYKKIKEYFDWIIYVDVDEFITTKKNNNKTIRDELETTFKDVTCIKVPWVLMSCNSIKKNPTSLLETNVYRWNHDNRHVNTISSDKKFRCRYETIECKCIFKPAFFNDILDHHPINPINNNNNNNRIVDSIHNNKSKLDSFYDNLREKNINEAYLICYHYRIISVEQCIHKIKTNIWYKHFTLDELLSSDNPEIIDETMRIKNKK